MKVINFLGGLIKAVLLLFVLAALLFTISETSFAPPNFKVVADFAFESAVKTAEPLKKYFPKPKPLPLMPPQNQEK
ncbi:MAG: hypothetical protein LBI01_02590 [Elusimicrobium sp.]|jgi:hypothetical protein|nr:hypothetical protein [Elusimicrobium sp.]